jgi:hypothetical protein
MPIPTNIAFSNLFKRKAKPRYIITPSTDIITTNTTNSAGGAVDTTTNFTTDRIVFNRRTPGAAGGLSENNSNSSDVGRGDDKGGVSRGDGGGDGDRR